jgi:hypothetical protein
MDGVVNAREMPMGEESIAARIANFQQMSVGELREEWRKLFNEEPRSRNRVGLWKRLAWRIQELEYGGLSERAKKRLEELMPTAELALRVPHGFMKDAAALPVIADRRVRDPRIPPPGTVLLRTYKNRKLAVTVLDDGFEWEGREYRSLSALAREVTGCSSLNGLAFFGLNRKGDAK